MGYKVNPRIRERHSFTWEELQTLFRVSKNNARDDALLRYYIHTSRRKDSACELLREDVWDAERSATLPFGVVLEKFNQRVQFPIDSVLSAAFARWILASPVSRFVFPSSLDAGCKWCTSGPHYWLHSLCKRAGIAGTHVHVHALRHTVATLLHKSGNKIEDISAYLGHKDAKTTRIYIDPSVSRPQDHMAIPWLTDPADMAGLRLSATSMAAVTQEAGGPIGHTGSSSSSTTTSTLGSVMMDATQQQQRLVTALTRRLADRDAEVGRHAETYNFLVGEVLADAQRLTLGEWQKREGRQQ